MAGVPKPKTEESLEAYRAFALRINKFKLQLSSAMISRNYISNLSQCEALMKRLTLLRSVTYDSQEHNQRREILRLLIGLLGHLGAKKLARISPVSNLLPRRNYSLNSPATYQRHGRADTGLFP